MSQPKWKFHSILGDIGVPEYDGAVLMVDTTGVYPPEMEVFQVDKGAKDEYGEPYRVTRYRVVVEADDWSMGDDDIRRMTDFMGEEEGVIENWLRSDDFEKIAFMLYYCVGAYYGFHEFDYPGEEMHMKQAASRVAWLKRHKGNKEPGQMPWKPRELSKADYLLFYGEEK